MPSFEDNHMAEHTINVAVAAVPIDPDLEFHELWEAAAAPTATVV